MPKLKRAETPYDKLTILISGYLVLNNKRLEDVLKCSYGKARARMLDPATFTIGELRTISRALGVPIEDMRQALSY